MPPLERLRLRVRVRLRARVPLPVPLLAPQQQQGCPSQRSLALLL